MSDTSIPFDYDKYKADPSAYRLFTGEGREVFKLEEVTGLQHYTLFAYFSKDPDSTGRYCTTKGALYKGRTTAGNITSMIPVKKIYKTEIEYKIPPLFQNVYLIKGKLTLGIPLTDYADCQRWSKRHEEKGDIFLCTLSIEQHPQLLEVLLSLGLAEKVIKKS